MPRLIDKVGEELEFLARKKSRDRHPHQQYKHRTPQPWSANSSITSKSLNSFISRPSLHTMTNLLQAPPQSRLPNLQIRHLPPRARHLPPLPPAKPLRLHKIQPSSRFHPATRPPPLSPPPHRPLPPRTRVPPPRKAVFHGSSQNLFQNVRSRKTLCLVSCEEEVAGCYGEEWDGAGGRD